MPAEPERGLRLLHVLPYYAPAWGFGGVVRAAYGLTTALAAQGHAVTVLTTDAGDDGTRLPAGEEMRDGVRVIRCRNLLPALRRVNLSTPGGMPARLRRLLPDVDLIHVHELRTVENLAVLRMARVPVVLSPHGTLVYGTGRSLVKRGWDALLGRWMTRRIAHVTTLTEDEAGDTRQLWARLGLPAVPVSEVPNGVNPAEFAALPDRGVFRTRWGVPEDVPLLLFLGRLHRRKGAHHLVAALAHLPDAWLAVVGPDEGEGAALHDLAESLGVADRVVFTGLLTGDDKLAAFAAADALALPAVGEGLPMVVLEAMAAGLPVAISTECHLPQAVDAGAAVLLDPLTPTAIGAALTPVLTDHALRQQMGAAGRMLVAARFTWQVVSVQMVAVYRDVLGLSS